MGICGEAPNEYCGHILEPEDGEADDNWHERVRNAVCLREPKYDGLCVWHADTDEKTAEELVEARLLPDDVPREVDYVKEHLSGAILRDIDFPYGFSFGGCVLIGSKFTNVQFRSTKYPDADLRLAEFSNSDLQSAKFSCANLKYVEFYQTNMRYATFLDTNLRDAVFIMVTIPDSKFIGSDLPGGEFRISYLAGAIFKNLGLPGVKFQYTNLRGVKFLNTGLPGAHFSNSFLYEVQFSDSNLNTADFSNIFLQETTFQNSQLHKTIFTGAVLREADFAEADLRGAEFTEADLRKAEFAETDLRDVAFQSACATPIQADYKDNDVRFPRTGAGKLITPPDDTTKDLCGASLEDAQFEDGTDLRGANLAGARLYQTGFRDVRINNETKFGLHNRSRFGEKCRYEYDPNTSVSVNEDISRLRAAAWTYRRLESLFEENAMDERAQGAHIRKEEAKRAYHKEQIQELGWTRAPLESLGKFGISTLNWHIHRHGESLTQLLKISALLIIGCGFLYPFAGGINSGQSGGPYRVNSLAEFFGPEGWVDLANGIYFSAITFTTIGYGDFYPAGIGSRILVALESLSGALLIALFVFVIGRRVAR